MRILSHRYVVKLLAGATNTRMKDWEQVSGPNTVGLSWWYQHQGGTLTGEHQVDQLYQQVRVNGETPDGVDMDDVQLYESEDA